MKFNIPQETLHLIPWGVTVFNRASQDYGLSREMVAEGGDLMVVVLRRVKHGYPVYEKWWTGDCQVKKWHKNTY